MDDRIAIFIDGGYLQRVLSDEFDGALIDFAKLADEIAGDADLLRTYYYNCLPYQSSPPTREERVRFAASRRFFTALELLPRYEVRLGRLEFRGNDADGAPRFEQKQVDILLGVDLVRMAAKGQIRQAALVAGDSDFIPAIAAAKAEGTLVRLYHGNSCHFDLRRIADERVKIDLEFINRTMRERN